MEYRLIVNSKSKSPLTKLHRLAETTGLECSLEKIDKKQPTIVDGFYRINRTRILDATTSEYRKFLKKADYGDLNSCSIMEIAEDMLKIDPKVRWAAARAGLSLAGNDGDYVVNINHPLARKLVEALGYKVLTTRLMYRLFIPYLKELVAQNNPEAQITLNKMTDTSFGKAEWLEDLVKDKKKVCIGTQEKRLALPDKEGYFDRADINEFGYPTRVKGRGEFCHWYVSEDERAAIRSGGSGLGLNLSWEPSFVFGWLGVRLAKIFYRE